MIFAVAEGNGVVGQFGSGIDHNQRQIGFAGCSLLGQRFKSGPVDPERANDNRAGPQLLGCPCGIRPVAIDDRKQLCLGERRRK